LGSAIKKGVARTCSAGLQATSAVAPIADYRAPILVVREVPILLQKSAYRRRGTAGAFF
jgi:hypothetical protein